MQPRTGTKNIFNSMLEYIEAASKPAVKTGWLSSEKEDSNWTGSRDMDHALELARDGWPEGLEMIQKALDEINAEPHVEPAPIFDVTGEAFNLDAVLQGQPENMFFFMDQETNKPRVISMAFNFTTGARTSASDIMKRGAAIASAVNDIEAAGIRVELFAYKKSRRGHYKTIGMIKIKDADQPLELERLCFAAAHPAMLRRLWFRIAEQYSDKEFAKRFGSTYGTPADLNVKEPAELGLENCINIQHADSTPEQVKATVKRQLDSILNNQ